MNVAIGNRQSQGLRVNARSMMLVLGASLALAAAVVVGAIGFGSQASQAEVDHNDAIQQARLATILARPTVEAPDLVFYLVANEDARALMESQLAEAEWLAVDGNFIPPQTRTRILMASSPEEEAEASRIIGESSSADARGGNKFEVHDLRK